MSNATEQSKSVEELKAMLESLKTQAAQFTEAEQSIKSEVAVHEAAILSLNQKMKILKNEAFEFKRSLKAAERELENAVKIEEQKAENERIRVEFARMSDEFDEITRSAKWFSAALPHQFEGAKRMAVAKRGLIADKMGLGKTLTSLMVCDMLKTKRVLVITTADLVQNFCDEIMRWTDREPVAMVKMPKITRDLILSTMINLDEYILVINYEAWRKDKELLAHLKALQFETVIVDEAHKIKTVKTSNFRGVREIVFAKNECPLCGSATKIHTDSYGGERVSCINDCDVSPVAEMAKRETGTAQFIWCSVKNFFPMTGTFILNRPQEIFASLSLVNPVRFSSLNRFLERYCTQNPWTNKWEFRAGGVKSLLTALEGNIISRDLKSAGISLPPQTVQFHNLTITEDEYPNQYKVLEDLKRFNAIDLGDKTLGVFHLLALITRQRQAITWPAGMHFTSVDGSQVWKCDVQESIKIDTIIRWNTGNGAGTDAEGWEGILSDATNDGERDEDGNWTGNRVVIYSQFKQPLIELENRCKQAGLTVVRLDGDTDEYTHNLIRQDFDRQTQINDPGYKPRWQVVLANYKSGGVGLNFTDITETIILDEEWNPGSRDQAYARTYRMGQVNETIVHVLRVADSIDEWMAALMEEKEKLVGGFESDMTSMLDALRDILGR